MSKLTLELKLIHSNFPRSPPENDSSLQVMLKSCKIPWEMSSVYWLENSLYSMEMYRDKNNLFSYI